MTYTRKAFTVKLLDLHQPFLAHCQAIDAAPPHLLSFLARQVVLGSIPLHSQPATVSPQILVTMASLAERDELHVVAAERGLTPAAAVRQACAQFLVGRSGLTASAAGHHPLLRAGGYQPTGERSGEGSIRCEIQLTDSEAAALKEQSETFGYPNVQALIVAVVRSYLRRGPVISPTVAASLGEMNLSLIRIGGNINLIARSIGKDEAAVTAEQLGRLATVMEGVSQQVKRISEELQMAAHRWDLVRVEK